MPHDRARPLAWASITGLVSLNSIPTQPKHSIPPHAKPLHALPCAPVKLHSHLLIRAHVTLMQHVTCPSRIEAGPRSCVLYSVAALAAQEMGSH